MYFLPYDIEGIQGDINNSLGDINNASYVVFNNSIICNFSFIAGSSYTITITQGENINKLTGFYLGRDDGERAFLITDKQNISGSTTYVHKVPALVAIDNN